MTWTFVGGMRIAFCFSQRSDLCYNQDFDKVFEDEPSSVAESLVCHCS